MPNIIESIINWASNNVMLIIIGGFLGYVIWSFVKIKSSKIAKPIDRSDIERKNYIKRMKYNVSTRYKKLFMGYEIIRSNGTLEPNGRKLLGKIVKYLETEIPDGEVITNTSTGISQFKTNGKKIPVISMVIKPMLFNGLMLNYLAKSQVIILVDNDKTIHKSISKEKIYIMDGIGVNNYFGIYHSMGGETEEVMAQNIRNFDVFKTDLNSLASIYFAKAQEQSTFDPAYAHAMALEQRKLEVELAKGKGKKDSI